MKIDKLNLDGKKGSIEVLDKIFSAKINNKLTNIEKIKASEEAKKTPDKKKK